MVAAKIGLSIVRQECHRRVVTSPHKSESSHLSLDLPSNDESRRHPDINMSQPLIGASVV